jgi:hypothetical protein
MYVVYFTQIQDVATCAIVEGQKLASLYFCVLRIVLDIFKLGVGLLGFLH